MSSALRRLQPLSLRRVSGVVVARTASAADYEAELSLPGNPVAPKPAPIRGVGAVLHWYFVMPGEVDRLSFFLADNDVKLYGVTLVHARSA